MSISNSFEVTSDVDGSSWRYDANEWNPKLKELAQRMGIDTHDGNYSNLDTSNTVVSTFRAGEDTNGLNQSDVHIASGRWPLALSSSRPVHPQEKLENSQDAKTSFDRQSYHGFSNQLSHTEGASGSNSNGMGNASTHNNVLRQLPPFPSGSTHFASNRNLHRAETLTQYRASNNDHDETPPPSITRPGSASSYARARAALPPTSDLIDNLMSASKPLQFPESSQSMGLQRNESSASQSGVKSASNQSLRNVPNSPFEKDYYSGDEKHQRQPQQHVEKPLQHQQTQRSVSVSRPDSPTPSSASMRAREAAKAWEPKWQTAMAREEHLRSSVLSMVGFLRDTQSETGSNVNTPVPTDGLDHAQNTQDNSEKLEAAKKMHSPIPSNGRSVKTISTDRTSSVSDASDESEVALPEPPMVLRRPSRLLNGELDISMSVLSDHASVGQLPRYAQQPRQNLQVSQIDNKLTTKQPPVSVEPDQPKWNNIPDPQHLQSEVQNTGNERILTSPDTKRRASKVTMVNKLPPSTAPAPVRHVSHREEINAVDAHDQMLHESARLPTPEFFTPMKIHQESHRIVDNTLDPQSAGPHKRTLTFLEESHKHPERVQWPTRVSNLPVTSPLKAPPLNATLALNLAHPGTFSVTNTLPARSTLTHVSSVPAGTVSLFARDTKLHLSHIDQQLSRRQNVEAAMREADLTMMGASLALDGRALQVQLEDARMHLLSAQAALNDERIRSKRLEEECKLYRTRDLKSQTDNKRGKELEIEYNELVSKEQQILKDLSLANEQKAQLESQILKTSANYEKLLKKLDKDLNAWKSEATKAQAQTKELSKLLKMEKLENKSISERLESAKQRIFQLENWKQQVVDVIQPLENKLLISQQKYVEIESDLESMRIKLDSETKQRTESEATLKLTTDGLERALEKLEATEEDNKKAYEEIDSIHKENLHLESMVESTRQRADDALNALSEASELQNELQNALEFTRTMLSERDLTIRSNTKLFEEIKTANHELTSKNALLEKSLKETQMAFEKALAQEAHISLALDDAFKAKMSLEKQASSQDELVKKIEKVTWEAKCEHDRAEKLESILRDKDRALVEASSLIKSVNEQLKQRDTDVARLKEEMDEREIRTEESLKHYKEQTISLKDALNRIKELELANMDNGKSSRFTANGAETSVTKSNSLFSNISFEKFEIGQLTSRTTPSTQKPLNEPAALFKNDPMPTDMMFRRASGTESTPLTHTSANDEDKGKTLLNRLDTSAAKVANSDANTSVSSSSPALSASSLKNTKPPVLGSDGIYDLAMASRPQSGSSNVTQVKLYENITNSFVGKTNHEAEAYESSLDRSDNDEDSEAHSSRSTPMNQIASIKSTSIDKLKRSIEHSLLHPHTRYVAGEDSTNSRMARINSFLSPPLHQQVQSSYLGNAENEEDEEDEETSEGEEEEEGEEEDHDYNDEEDTSEDESGIGTETISWRERYSFTRERYKMSFANDKDDDDDEDEEGYNEEHEEFEH